MPAVPRALRLCRLRQVETPEHALRPCDGSPILIECRFAFLSRIPLPFFPVSPDNSICDYHNIPLISKFVYDVLYRPQWYCLKYTGYLHLRECG